MRVGDVHYVAGHDGQAGLHAARVTFRPPRNEDVAGMFEFVDAHSGEPVLVHCLAGLSRSPAFALGIIVRGMVPTGCTDESQQSLVERASSLLLQVRRRSRPNGLLLQLCFEQFMPSEKAQQQLATAFVNHPPLLENRIQQSQEISQARRAYRLGD